MPATLAADLNLSSTFARLYEPIAEDLAQAERIFVEELASDVPYIRRLVDHLGHYRGKRLRSSLLLMTARACGKMTPEHHTLAAVVEMIHTATLVHDDVLDEADLRRHVPTVNAEWGNPSSVLLGDLLFTHAFYLASTTGSTTACRLIGEATNRVCAGELQQIGERGNLDLTEDEYFSVIEGKTAELTACCCRLGAVFSEASDDVVEKMADYGRLVGIAFQIADDVLDLVGQETEAGKSLGTDLDQQKLTLPMIHLLRESDPEQAGSVRRIITSSDNHRAEKLLPFLRQSEAISYAIRRAEEYAARAREALACLSPSPARRILEEVTQLVVHRGT